MTLSAKLTAVSFFALTGVAAGSFAFAGCTVTSGNPTTGDGGGTPITTPTGDSSTGDSSTGDAGAAVCEGNKQSTGDFFNAKCQAKLNSVCCTELKTCFDIVPVADDAGARGMDDCNAHQVCYVKCLTKADGTPETDQTKLNACYDDCDTLAPQNVVDAYNAIDKCAMTKASDVCK